MKNFKILYECIEGPKQLEIIQDSLSKLFRKMKKNKNLNSYFSQI